MLRRSGSPSEDAVSPEQLAGRLSRTSAGKATRRLAFARTEDGLPPASAANAAALFSGMQPEGAPVGPVHTGTASAAMARDACAHRLLQLLNRVRVAVLVWFL